MLELDIISNWPWTIVSSDLSAVSTWTFSVSVHTSALWKLWGSCCEFFIVWFLIFLFFSITIQLNKPVSGSGESSNLSALSFSFSIKSVQTGAFWKLWEIKSI